MKNVTIFNHPLIQHKTTILRQTTTTNKAAPKAKADTHRMALRRLHSARPRRFRFFRGALGYHRELYQKSSAQRACAFLL